MQWILTYSAAVFILISTGVECFELWTDFERSVNVAPKFKCLEEGRFSHPLSCGGYVECVRNPKSGWKRRFGSCHGTVFSQQSRTCMTPAEDYECKSSVRVARSLSNERRHNNLCSIVSNGFVCADCKTAVNCVEGVAYTETCGMGDTCSEIPEFGGAVCYPTPALECNCNDTTNEFFADAYDQQAFFFCGEAETEPDFYHCPDDMVFDGLFSQCVNRDGMPHCTEAGFFPYYNDCSNFYTCINSKDGWVQKTFSCEGALMYNEDSGTCEDPCSWDTGAFDCQEEGRFADPLSCEHYYQCIQDGLGGFRQERRQCPNGYQWGENALSGNSHCTNDPNNNCTTVKVSKCFIPENRCSSVAAAGGETGDATVDPIPRVRGGVASNRNIRRPYSPLPYAAAQSRVWEVLSRGDRRARNNRYLSVSVL